MIYAHSNANTRPGRTEPASKKPSVTVPDMVPPIKDLMQRVVRGLPVQTFEPVYTTDPRLDNIEKMSGLGKADLAKMFKQMAKQSFDTLLKEQNERKAQAAAAAETAASAANQSRKEPTE